MVSWDSKIQNFASSRFFLIIIRSGRLAQISWSVCISKSQKNLCILFSRIDSGLCIYHFFIWSNFNFLHSSLWITLHTKSNLVLYSFWANLQHSLMWWILSSLLPHNLHLLVCCRLSLLALIWLVIMTSFCDTIKWDLLLLLLLLLITH